MKKEMYIFHSPVQEWSSTPLKMECRSTTTSYIKKKSGTQLPLWVSVESSPATSYTPAGVMSLGVKLSLASLNTSKMTSVMYFSNFFIFAPLTTVPQFSKLSLIYVRIEFSDLKNLRLDTFYNILTFNSLSRYHNFSSWGNLISKLNSATPCTQHLMSRFNFLSF